MKPKTPNILKSRMVRLFFNYKIDKFFNKRVSQYLLLILDELFDDLEDDPDLVEKECLEIFNSYTTSAESNSNKKTNDITIPTDDYENTTFGKKRMAHSTSVMSDHSVLRHKSARRPNNVKSAQEVMLERYKTIEKAKETPVPVTTPQPAPILGLNR